MAFLEVEGGKIFYEVKGEGPPMVMLRGLGRSSRHWLGFDEVMAKDFTVITTDARGMGRSQCPVSWNLSIYDLANDISRILDELSLPSAHIFGVSLGGMVAIAYGLKHGHRTNSLTIVNSSIAGSNTLRLTLPGVHALALGAVRRSKLHHYLAEVLVARDYPREKKRELEMIWDQIKEEEGIPTSTVIKQLIAAGKFHVARRLRDLKIPTLVISGGDDLFVPPKNSRIIHDLLPNAHFVLIEKGGHELTIDSPELVEKAVRDFVARI